MQILRRLAWGLGMTKKTGSATAPREFTLHFDPDEVHGRAMLTLGLSDARADRDKRLIFYFYTGLARYGEITSPDWPFKEIDR